MPCSPTVLPPTGVLESTAGLQAESVSAAAHCVDSPRFKWSRSTEQSCQWVETQVACPDSLDLRGAVCGICLKTGAATWQFWGCWSPCVVGEGPVSWEAELGHDHFCWAFQLDHCPASSVWFGATFRKFCSLHRCTRCVFEHQLQK